MTSIPITSTSGFSITSKQFLLEYAQLCTKHNLQFDVSPYVLHPVVIPCNNMDELHRHLFDIECDMRSVGVEEGVDGPLCK